ncbi:hypothetical protein N7478_001645 [Penicillium angulare]|uniref:uncharacterized protein n=1 Tax=Penicillium angulare TaxID=116970 RepID=UPI002540B8F3|nr:uncharacterized protein N7478_001645 [Penicillium angulare]KAJ5288615.1 hypothetical protein N7478_001645 [Penicillium angulare]
MTCIHKKEEEKEVKKELAGENHAKTKNQDFYKNEGVQEVKNVPLIRIRGKASGIDPAVEASRRYGAVHDDVSGGACITWFNRDRRVPFGIEDVRLRT